MTDLTKLTMLIDEVANVESHLKMGEMSWFLNSDEIAAHLLSHGVYVRESQKPCKFEEISSSDYCWIEYKYEFYTTVEIAYAHCKTSEYCRIDLVGHCSSTAHRKELYNKTWRVWNKKPTEVERKNAKWEE